MNLNDFLTEEKKVLVQERLPYGKSDLDPVMSEDTINFHYGKLAKAYVTKFNEGKGDAQFMEAGAFLHNIFFPQLKAPGGSNNPTGASKELIDSKYGDFATFKEQFEDRKSVV